MSHTSQLKVFASSTSDLHEWRKATKGTLSELSIDGSLFEDWPSTPNHPINECLLQIDESDAYIIILGAEYGTITESGLSETHIEYRHAIKEKPVFAYILDKPERETEQVFMNSVFYKHNVKNNRRVYCLDNVNLKSVSFILYTIVLLS